MQSDAKTVDEYIESLPPERKESITQVRELILETIPHVNETMKYRMPTYELNEMVCALASQKNYMSLYMDVELIDSHSADFSHLNVGKSCIRFKNYADLPEETIRLILEKTIRKQETK